LNQAMETSKRVLQASNTDYQTLYVSTIAEPRRRQSNGHVRAVHGIIW
jgi:hypothetical protein